MGEESCLREEEKTVEMHFSKKRDSCIFAKNVTTAFLQKCIKRCTPGGQTPILSAASWGVRAQGDAAAGHPA